MSGIAFKAFSICKPACSIEAKSGPYIFNPIGAFIPVDSITCRVAMGCSFGLPVNPGRLESLTISCQISSSFLILSRHRRM